MCSFWKPAVGGFLNRGELSKAAKLLISVPELPVERWQREFRT